MPYVVMVDDNFHYMDEDEGSCFGAFPDAEVAIGHCRRIVEESLASAYKSGMSAEDLWASYQMFGEDAFMQSIEVPPILASQEGGSAIRGTTRPAALDGSDSCEAAAA